MWRLRASPGYPRMNSPALIGRRWPGSGSTPLPSMAGCQDVNLHKYLVTVQPIAAGVGREPTKLEKQLYPIDCSTETYGLTAVVTCGYPV
jgi:hypothetical protein